MFSKGFFDLLYEIKMSPINSILSVVIFSSKILDNNKNVASVAFLADIFQHTRL